MDTEADDIKKILTEAGYEVIPIEKPFDDLTPITEAVKDAPKHWP